ncbi:MAG: transcription elongation factor GreA [Deltaproteobacteria bacterium]|nr:transcription elongation factor GreA [Deltaproteobacteria bacterium]
MERRPITREGYDKLLKELKRLKNIERPKVIKDIETARAHGDLSENAEYSAAKEKQSLIEGKIQDIESRMSYIQVIEITNLPNDRVVFGSTVLLENVNTGERVRYQIVGPDESDVSNGKISVTSPVGKALIGKEIDDVVTIKTPGGIREYEILEIN